MTIDKTFWAFIAFTAFAVAMVVGAGWAIYKEATFDYTVCNPTSQYREQHRAAWTSYTQVGNVQVPTYHPARNWTERLYSCPDEGDWFDKWRVENKGGAQ